jgi:hypothetical protein
MGGNVTQCTACANDGPSKYSNADESFACESAPPGKKPTADHTDIETCPAGEFSSSGESCSPCNTGYISNNTEGAPFCSPCTAGKKANVHKTACLDCPPGTYSDIAQTECKACDFGEFAEGYGNDSCESCEKVRMGKERSIYAHSTRLF